MSGDAEDMRGDAGDQNYMEIDDYYKSFIGPGSSEDPVDDSPNQGILLFISRYLQSGTLCRRLQDCVCIYYI